MRTLLPSEVQSVTVSTPRKLLTEPSFHSDHVQTLGPRLRELYAVDKERRLPVRLTELAEQLIRRERARGA